MIQYDIYQEMLRICEDVTHLIPLMKIENNYTEEHEKYTTDLQKAFQKIQEKMIHNGYTNNISPQNT